MKVRYLIHQTSAENLPSILSRGLKPTLKHVRLVEEYGDLERFIWFDFMGDINEEIVYSKTGHSTSANLGVTLVLDFYKVLSKITKDSAFQLRFLSECVRFEDNTDSITKWVSDELPNPVVYNPELHPELPDSIVNSVECVLSTDMIDSTLSRYVENNNEPIYFDIMDCLERIVVCKTDEARAKSVIPPHIEVVVQKPISRKQKEIIESSCKSGTLKKEMCYSMYIQMFIMNCHGVEQ